MLDKRIILGCSVIFLAAIFVISCSKTPKNTQGSKSDASQSKGSEQQSQNQAPPIEEGESESEVFQALKSEFETVLLQWRSDFADASPDERKELLKNHPTKKWATKFLTFAEGATDTIARLESAEFVLENGAPTEKNDAGVLVLGLMNKLPEKIGMELRFKVLEQGAGQVVDTAATQLIAIAKQDLESETAQAIVEKLVLRKVDLQLLKPLVEATLKIAGKKTTKEIGQSLAAISSLENESYVLQAMDLLTKQEAYHPIVLKHIDGFRRNPGPEHEQYLKLLSEKLEGEALGYALESFADFVGRVEVMRGYYFGQPRSALSGADEKRKDYIFRMPEPGENDELIAKIKSFVAKHEEQVEFPGLIKELKSKLFVLEKLTIGNEVPEIEANDLDGVAFKLSDYRGKVVLLDFWGDW